MHPPYCQDGRFLGLQKTSEKLSVSADDQLPKAPRPKISPYPMATCPRKACEEAIDTVLGLQSISDASPLLPRRKISSKPIDGNRRRASCSEFFKAGSCPSRVFDSQWGYSQ
jgi:hypothetical protein